ncbi:MAG: hypothetical protein LUG21_05080, partial [Clostridiales bacterium]|nr:hypothetical protein [Clostridiales bacterium]
MGIYFSASGFGKSFTPEFASELKKYIPRSCRLAFIASDFNCRLKSKISLHFLKKKFKIVK